jgi:competence protein ComEC
MKRSEKFIYFLVLFAFGVLLGVFFERRDFVLIFYLFFLSVFYFTVFLKKISLREFLLFSLALLCGVFRFYVAIADETNFVFSQDDYFISGRICAEPDFREDKIKYVLCDLSAEKDGEDSSLDGKMLLNAPIFPEFSYGEKISFMGRIEKPFSTYEFSYEDYLYRFDVYYFVKSPSSLFSEGSVSGWNLFLNQVFNFKRKLLSQISFVFNEPDASLVSGILLGTRRGFSDEVNENFKNAGLMHIVAVSGYNISILIVFVFSVFSFFGRSTRIFLSILTVFLFILISGFSASAIRAGIMGGLSLFAIYSGKTYQVKISLFLSAFLMIFFNPKIIFYDVGFQLSFLATLGLVYLSKSVGDFFSFLPDFFEIRTSISLTVSATLCVFPIMAISFGSMSLLSPLSNLLVLPFIPLFMLFSFVSIIFSFLFVDLSLIFGFFAYAISCFVFFVSEFFGSLSFGFLNLERIPAFFILLYSCFLLFEIKQTS